MSLFRRAPLFLVAASIGLAAAGCQSLMLGDLTDNPKQQDAVLAAASDAEKYSIEFHSVDGKPERVEMPLQAPLFLQDALDNSEALAHFRREKIQLYRKTSESAPYTRLEVAYDRSKRRVFPESDYAIHSGDRLIITEDTSTFVDDMLGSVRGPFAGLAKHR